MTEATLKSFHVDVLFAGCDGADSKGGFYLSNLSTSSLDQQMVKIATHVIVVEVSVKFGRKGFVRFAEPEQVHRSNRHALVRRRSGNPGGERHQHSYCRAGVKYRS